MSLELILGEDEEQTTDSAFSKVSLMLVKEQAVNFALKVENEKLLARNAEIEKSNRIINELYINVCNVNLSLHKKIEGMK